MMQVVLFAVKKKSAQSYGWTNGGVGRGLPSFERAEQPRGTPPSIQPVQV